MAEGSTILAPAEEGTGSTGQPKLRLVKSTEPEYLRPLLEGEKAFDGDVVTITKYVGGEISDVRRMVIDWDALEQYSQTT